MDAGAKSHPVVEGDSTPIQVKATTLKEVMNQRKTDVALACPEYKVVLVPPQNVCQPATLPTLIPVYLEDDVKDHKMSSVMKGKLTKNVANMYPFSQRNFHAYAPPKEETGNCVVFLVL